MIISGDIPQDSRDSVRKEQEMFAPVGRELDSQQTGKHIQAGKSLHDTSPFDVEGLLFDKHQLCRFRKAGSIHPAWGFGFREDNGMNATIHRDENEAARTTISELIYARADSTRPAAVCARETSRILHALSALPRWPEDQQRQRVSA